MAPSEQPGRLVPTQPSASASPGITLRHSVLSLLTVAGLGAIIMSPALGLYFNWGPMSIATGPIAPLIYMLALLISLPTAISYAMVSKEIPAAGQAYTWLWHAFRPEYGLWTGAILVLYYVSGLWIVNMFFAVFFGEFLRYFGVPASPIGGAIGMLIMAAITAIVVYRDIQFTARVALGFMIFETGVVSALALTIVFVQGSHGKLSLAPFSFPSATAGFNGISTAVIFGILSFIGYDYACVVAEETKTPRRLIPIAVILAAVTVGVFWMLGSYAYSESIPLSQLPGFISSGFTPITPIAKIYWGPGNILITITGLTASLGIYVAIVPATARILFAMGRDRSLPQSLGKLNARYQVPFNALTVVLIGGFVGALVMAILQQSYFNAYVWFGEISVFFALVTYIAVNLASISFYRRFRPQKFNVVWNLIVPIVGIGIDLYILWQSFFVALTSSGFALGQSVVLFAVVWCLIAVFYVAALRLWVPHLFRAQSYVLPETVE